MLARPGQLNFHPNWYVLKRKKNMCRSTFQDYNNMLKALHLTQIFIKPKGKQVLNFLPYIFTLIFLKKNDPPDDFGNHPALARSLHT